MLEYRMSSAQSAAWSLADAFREAVEDAIAEEIQEAGCIEDVVVVLDDGTVAYALELGRA